MQVLVVEKTFRHSDQLKKIKNRYEAKPSKPFKISKAL